MEVLDKKFRLYITEGKILSRVKRLGTQISYDLVGKNPLLVVNLNGAMVFGVDLHRSITIPSELTTIRLKSYAGTKSTGEIKTIMPLQEDIVGRTVVIVEDIVDSGATIQAIVQQMKDLGAADVRIATLLFKKEACKIENLPLDYVGFEIPNKFVVGYGLDYNGYGRNLRDIFVPAKE